MNAQVRPVLAEARKPENAIDLNKVGRQIAKDAGGDTVAKFFDANKEAIKAVLPAHMTPDRMLKIGLRALRTTPKLMQCTVSSLFGALITCAQLGLEPNTPQGHIYLIPFENRKKGVTEVQIVIGYKGLIDLARRSGQIISISSHPVCKNEPFEVCFGTEEKIEHRPLLTGGERGDVVGFYAVAKLVGGGTQFEFMTAKEVNSIRDGSQGYKTAVRFDKNDTPWISNYEEMGRKTAIRRLCKYLPMSIELATAVALEGRAETNEPQGLDRVIEGEFSILADDAPVIPEDDGDGTHITEDGEVIETQSTAAEPEPERDNDSPPAQTKTETKGETKPTKSATTKPQPSGAGMFDE